VEGKKFLIKKPKKRRVFCKRGFLYFATGQSISKTVFVAGVSKRSNGADSSDLFLFFNKKRNLAKPMVLRGLAEQVLQGSSTKKKSVILG